MQMQTRVISTDFEKFVKKSAQDHDVLLDLQTALLDLQAALLDEKRIRDSGAFTDLMVHSRMETIVRDCIVSERLGESWSKYLEGLIQGLATFFEEVQDGTL